MINFKAPEGLNIFKKIIKRKTLAPEGQNKMKDYGRHLFSDFLSHSFCSQKQRCPDNFGYQRRFVQVYKRNNNQSKTKIIYYQWCARPCPSVDELQTQYEPVGQCARNKRTQHKIY